MSPSGATWGKGTLDDMTEHDQTTHELVCAECATEAPPGAVGWRALLTVGEDAEDVEEVAVYCPTCAAREFAGQ